eukprot:Clim_evm88s25 gene=Clim_evmTU88s25
MPGAMQVVRKTRSMRKRSPQQQIKTFAIAEHRKPLSSIQEKVTTKLVRFEDNSIQFKTPKPRGRKTSSQAQGSSTEELSLKQQNSQLALQNSQLSATITGLENQLSELKKELFESNRKSSELQRNLEAAQQKITSLHAELLESQKRIHGENEQLRKALKNVEAAKARDLQVQLEYQRQRTIVEKLRLSESHEKLGAANDELAEALKRSRAEQRQLKVKLEATDRERKWDKDCLNDRFLSDYNTLRDMTDMMKTQMKKFEEDKRRWQTLYVINKY